MDAGHTDARRALCVMSSYHLGLRRWGEIGKEREEGIRRERDELRENEKEEMRERYRKKERKQTDVILIRNQPPKKGHREKGTGSRECKRRGKET